MLLLLLLLLVLFGGSHWGYRNWGPQGGISLGGILLIILLVYLFIGFGGGPYWGHW